MNNFKTNLASKKDCCSEEKFLIMILLRDLKDIFNFDDLDIDLKLRGYYAEGNSLNTPVDLIVIEEAPGIRKTYFRQQYYNLHIPWNYHIVALRGIDTPHWFMSSSYHLLASSHRQLKAFKPYCFKRSPYLNVSAAGGSCYNGSTSCTTPREKIIECLNLWWMGTPNADYPLSSHPLHKAVVKDVHSSNPPVKFPDPTPYGIISSESLEEDLVSDIISVKRNLPLFFERWEKMSQQEVLDYQRDAQPLSDPNVTSIGSTGYKYLNHLHFKFFRS